MRPLRATTCESHWYQCSYEQDHNQPNIYWCLAFLMRSEYYQALGHNERILSYETPQAS